MRALGLVMATALVCTAGSAGALPIAIASHERSVAVEASASSPASADASSASDSAVEGSASLHQLAPAAVGSDASAAGEASQASELADASLAGQGVASAQAFADAADAFAQASADSLYRVEFAATADAALRLLGSVSAFASGAADALAFVELASVDSTLDPLLLRFTAGPGESLPIDAIVALQAGLSYRLTALARAGTDALDFESSTSDAAWSFELVVPEPGTAALLALGTALLARRPPALRCAAPPRPSAPGRRSGRAPAARDRRR